MIGLWNITTTSLENTFNAGNVEVTGEDATDVGGIVGKFMGGNIKNCFHTTEYPLIGNGEDEKEEITGKISNCYCMEANTSPWNGEITKTMEELKERGIWFACADMDGEIMYRHNLTGPIGLVIGNEGKGVSRLVKEHCDYVASIPMAGDIDSLNASVAAGVLAYEIVRQRIKQEGK